MNADALSTPPADDVREALAATTEQRDRVADYLWDQMVGVAKSTVREVMADAFAAAGITVTAEVRPHGTVTDAEKPERLAERYVSAFVGDRADDSSTIVYRGPLLEMVTNAVREAAEAAREVHP